RLHQQTTYIYDVLTAINEKFDYSKLPSPTKQVLISTILAGCFSVELFGHTKYTQSGYSVEKYIQTNFPTLLPRITLTMTQLNIFSKDPDRCAGLALNFAIANAVIENPATFSQIIKIKIETDLPMALELGIINRIKTTFSNYYNIELSSTIPSNDADFCLSTHALSEHINSNDTLLINAQVSIIDLLAIHKKIAKILEIKKEDNEG
ncbi:M protein trans-acting positive regulator, partial [Enterococcus faecalis]|nr:M protein trans-acting positive regulator [Enterococcus faecalis]